ncbi:MAG: hypothetical protein LBK43_05315 [Treponema sp.]|nr:hypothetical protein [Treponema sp.]
MKGNIFIASVVFIGILVFSACNREPENSNDGFYFDEKTFTSEWNEWKNKNIQNYSFTLVGKLPHWNFSRAILMYEYKVNIIVKNGVMDSFEYIGDVPYEDGGALILEPEFTSISDMYQKISDMAKEENEWWVQYSGDGGIISTMFKVKYDAQLHYITFFEPISKWKQDYIVDTTAHAVTISNLIVLDNK